MYFYGHLDNHVSGLPVEVGKQAKIRSTLQMYPNCRAPRPSTLPPRSPYHTKWISHICSWRAYVRDPRAPSPRPLDTGLLLCEGHGLLLAPPHVEEFLSGERRALLGGLDRDRSGCVCEILTPEEWDALTLVRF